MLVMNYEVRRTTIEDFFSAPKHNDIIEEYAIESRGDYLPKITTDKDLYLRLEAQNMFDLLCLYLNDEMVGFISLLTTPMPHYSRNQTTVESFYVYPDHRKHGTGKQLVSAAEQIARDRESCVLYITAPSQGRLAKVAPSYGFHETNRIYAKGLE